MKDSTFNGFWPDTLRDDWRIVFIVFAGCIIVCAALRLTAPQIMASQNCNRRPVVAAMATEDDPPPLISARVCSSCISKSKSSSLALVVVDDDEIHPPVLQVCRIPGNDDAWRRDDDNLGRFVGLLAMALRIPIDIGLAAITIALVVKATNRRRSRSIATTN